MTQATIFLRAAVCFAELVREIGDDQWRRPALGVWDVRALVGHTARALETVVDYLALPEPETVELPTAQAYYGAFAHSPDRRLLDEAVAARGTAAGEALGEDPAAAVEDTVATVRSALAGVSPRRTVATRFGTLPLDEYLRTRTFELVVHGDDLTRATGLVADFPSEAVTNAVELAAQTAAALGAGPRLLAALTGRGPLPEGFSII